MKLLKYIHLTLTLLVFSIGIANAQQNTDYVDLGLPSGTLWATCNVGAEYPWEFGEYFAWGEIKSKRNYTIETYKHANGDHDRLTKYCTKSTYGNYFFTDDLIVLEPEDDVATIRMGSKWRIPTKSDWEELMEYSICVQMQNYNGSGVDGIIFKSKKYPNRHIFMPAAGRRHDTRFLNGNMYWSSSLCTKSDEDWLQQWVAWSIEFDICDECDSPDMSPDLPRDSGLPIRAVRNK